MLVESSAITGLDLTDDLESHGYAVEGPVACAAAAHDRAGTTRLITPAMNRGFLSMS